MAGSWCFVFGSRLIFRFKEIRIGLGSYSFVCSETFPTGLLNGKLSI